VTESSAVVTWDPPANNGSPITSYDVGYATTDVDPTTIVAATSPKTVTGLVPSTTYYIRVRATNVVGSSAWSTATVITTLAAANVRVSGVWVNAIPWVTVSGVPKQAVPWVKVSGVWEKAI
jgi:hypothetical protein